MRIADLLNGPSERLFHGTSEWAVKQVHSSGTTKPVYDETNVSMGGAYLTCLENVAKVAATNAARAHRSVPVVLTVKIKYPLLPDEDWVVAAAEHPLPEDFDWATETYKDERYRGFFDELFSEYQGDGHSLSDEYIRRYDSLNSRYEITWKDSMKYTHSVRQEYPLSADQILSTAYLA